MSSQAKPAPARFGDHHGQEGLDAGKAVRRLEDVLVSGQPAPVAVTAVIGRDAVDGAGCQVLPKRFDVLTGSYRRRAARHRPQPDQVVLVEREVLRARLAGDPRPASLGGGHQFGGAGRAHVHDVHPRTRVLGEQDRAVDRLDLHDRWTGLGVRQRIFAPRRSHRRDAVVDQRVVLRMDA